MPAKEQGRDRRSNCVEYVRSLSDVQETAQLLAGESLPLVLLNGLISKSELDLKGQTNLVGLNLTPYDGWFEKVARKFQQVSEVAYPMKTLSMSKNLQATQFVEKTIALELLQDSFSICFDLISLGVESWMHRLAQERARLPTCAANEPQQGSELGRL